MSRFEVHIEAHTPAFDPDPARQIVDILHLLATRVMAAVPGEVYPIWDSNGVDVGKAEFIP